MPVLQVWKAGTVMFIKRSLASGYAGIEIPVLSRQHHDAARDAKKVTESIVKRCEERPSCSGEPTDGLVLVIIPQIVTPTRGSSKSFHRPFGRTEFQGRGDKYEE